MELSHKRARIELEKAANTNARNYEVRVTVADGWVSWAADRTRVVYLHLCFVLGLDFSRAVLWFAVVCLRMCIINFFL